MLSVPSNESLTKTLCLILFWGVVSHFSVFQWAKRSRATYMVEWFEAELNSSKEWNGVWPFRIMITIRGKSQLLPTLPAQHGLFRDCASDPSSLWSLNLTHCLIQLKLLKVQSVGHMDAVHAMKSHSLCLACEQNSKNARQHCSEFCQGQANGQGGSAGRQTLSLDTGLNLALPLPCSGSASHPGHLLC